MEEIFQASEDNQQNPARLSKIMKILDSCSDYNGPSIFCNCINKIMDNQ
jgi:hypothetical protein